MKIALASDHGGFELKEYIKEYLMKNKYEILDLGTNNEDSVDYPDYGKKAGEAVVNKYADYAIIICGTGIGISISANKVKGVRAALCHDHYTAKLTRLHNDANVLAMGGRVVGKEVAIDMVETFLNTKFEGGRHQQRIDKMMSIEEA